VFVILKARCPKVRNEMLFPLPPESDVIGVGDPVVVPECGELLGSLLEVGAVWLSATMIIRLKKVLED